MRSNVFLLMAALVLGSPALLAACGDERPHTAPNPQDKPTPIELGWSELDPAALSPSRQVQQRRAVAARDKLFAALSSKVMSAMQAGGAVKAIGYCKIAAPNIHGQVAESEALAIGRTSFKLRNPANKAPAWAEGYVRQKRAEPALLGHEDGRFAALLPIRMMALCTRCHGSPGAIDPEALKEIERLYPEDTAVGFEQGDLRGYFWIEVPAP